MTLEEAVNIATKYINLDCYWSDKRQALVILLEENKRLKSLLSDRLPNGGMRVHGIKNSMQPTTENDKV